MSSQQARSRLRALGWQPVYVPRTSGKLKLGHLSLPVVDGLRLRGWVHPRLAWPWPQGDAIQLEDDRDYGDPQAVSLLGVDASSLVRRARKARLRLSVDQGGSLRVSGDSRHIALIDEIRAHEPEVALYLQRARKDS